MNKEEIKKILPHRNPILLVDSVVAYYLDPGESAIVCNKFVSSDEPVFKGHFPDEPIWPGVYTVEGFAQSAGILLYLMNRGEKKTKGYFSGIDKARFSGMIVPEDTIIYTVNFLRQKRSFYFFSCEAHVEQKRVAKAEIMLIIP